MRQITSDDLAAGHRYIYQGPPEFPLWPWQGPQWAVGAATFILLGLSMFLTRPPFMVGVVLFFFVHSAVAFAAGKAIKPLLDPDRGVRYHVQTLLAEINAPREDTQVRVSETALPASLLTDPQE